MAVERWMEAVAVEGEQRGHDRGVAEGREQGVAEGRAAAIVRVLGLRGITLTEAERQRILQCRDDATLHR